MARVRYLTISRVSMELVTKLSPEENALFNRALFSCFHQLENGEEPEIMETESDILNFCLAEAVDELVSGYRTYIKRINAAKGDKGKQDDSETGQRFITDKSVMDQSSTEEGFDRPKGFDRNIDTFKPAGLEEGQKEEIIGRLKALGIEKADSGFWNTCFVYGYDCVDTALSRAETLGNSNLKYITGLIANG